jgi:hypothetical protein
MYAICGLAATFSLCTSALHNQFSGLVVVLFCAAVWFGVSHLRYVEFGMAGKMFLKGSFRRIIDAETRLSDLESGLLKAVDVHDCWAKIVPRLGEFGFEGVRLSIDGVVLEHFRSSESKFCCWQLRIPLDNQHYINFFSRSDAPPSPIPAGALATAMQRGLRPLTEPRRLELLEEAPLRDLDLASARHD